MQNIDGSCSVGIGRYIGGEGLLSHMSAIDRFKVFQLGHFLNIDIIRQRSLLLYMNILYLSACEQATRSRTFSTCQAHFLFFFFDIITHMQPTRAMMKTEHVRRRHGHGTSNKRGARSTTSSMSNIGVNYKRRHSTLSKATEYMIK